MTDAGKTVQVAGVDLQFPDITTLEARIEDEKQALLALEQGPLTRDPRNADAWRDVERRAATMRDLLFALDDWVKADEALLDRQIEDALAAIRALGAPII